MRTRGIQLSPQPYFSFDRFMANIEKQNQLEFLIKEIQQMSVATTYKTNDRVRCHQEPPIEGATLYSEDSSKGEKSELTPFPPVPSGWGHLANIKYNWGTRAKEGKKPHKTEKDNPAQQKTCQQ